jgi:hypothetical protein
MWVQPFLILFISVLSLCSVQAAHLKDYTYEPHRIFCEFKNLPASHWIRNPKLHPERKLRLNLVLEAHHDTYSKEAEGKFRALAEAEKIRYGLEGTFWGSRYQKPNFFEVEDARLYFLVLTLRNSRIRPGKDLDALVVTATDLLYAPTSLFATVLRRLGNQEPHAFLSLIYKQRDVLKILLKKNYTRYIEIVRRFYQLSGSPRAFKTMRATLLQTAYDLAVEKYPPPQNVGWEITQVLDDPDISYFFDEYIKIQWRNSVLLKKIFVEMQAQLDAKDYRPIFVQVGADHFRGLLEGIRSNELYKEIDLRVIDIDN